MARLRAYVPIDMLNFSSSVGRVSYADPHLLVIKVGQANTFYGGDFTYPHGTWAGRIHSIEETYRGHSVLSVTGLNLSTRAATVGANREKVVKTALSGADRIVGSTGDDVLAGFKGKDVVAGGRGSDKLIGGGGDDLILAGQGRDVLIGGKGDDHFRFGAHDGRNVVRDFDPGHDELQIRGGLHFRDLDISDTHRGAVVEFGHAEVLLQDVSAHELDRGDFHFL